MRQIAAVLGVVILILGLMLGAFFAGAKSGVFGSPVQTVEKTKTTEIVQAVERRSDVVLLSAATQGLHTVERNAKFFKWDVPGSKRTNILQYSFNSQLGIDGGAVKIEETGDNKFTVTIPSFKILGYNDPEFKTVVDDDGALSFVTAEVDTAEAVTEVFGDKEREKQINDNRQLLEDQAKSYYTNIVRAIDKNAELEFEYTK